MDDLFKNTLPKLVEKDEVNPQVDQFSITPTAIKRRHLGGLINLSSDEVTSASLSNGQQVVLTSTLTESGGFADKGLIAEFYFAAFVGSLSTANQIGVGSSIDESQFQVIGPWYDYTAYNIAGFPKYKSVARVYIRNISAGSITLNMVTMWKLLSQGEIQ